jgi:transposase
MTAMPQRGRRHSIVTVNEARRYAEAGWSVAWIARRLGVAKGTVARWVDEDRHARWMEDSDRWHAVRAAKSGAMGMGRKQRPEFKFARMEALKAEGLSCAAIAKVMNFDFGDGLSRHQVEYALVMGRYPSSPSREVAA